jgi:predicted nucleotidyltransferase
MTEDGEQEMAGSLDYMSQRERRALVQFGNAVKRRLGDNIVKMTVFGSKIRGESVEASDIDILVLVKDRSLTVMDQIAEITSVLNIDYDLSISPIVFAEREYEMNATMASPFSQTVLQEGVLLS